MIPTRKSNRKLASFFILVGLLPLAACAQKKLPAVFGKAQNSVSHDYQFRLTGLGTALGETPNSLAEHGIDFKLTGQVEAGPAPNGQTHHHQLPEQDRETLQTTWNSLLKSGLTPTEKCTAIDATSDLIALNVRISIQQNERETALIRVDGGQICGPAETPALVDFSKTLVALARRHYPKKFPSECLASTDELQSIHDKLLSCDSDADCANIDDHYTPIPRGELQFVGLKNCSVLPRLIGANAESVRTDRKALLAARDSALKACESEIKELACTTETDPGFQNHRYPARCLSGRCVAGKVLR